MNSGFIIPCISVNIRYVIAVKISRGIKHPAISTITITDADPHVIRNTQTTVKLVFKSFVESIIQY